MHNFIYVVTSNCPIMRKHKTDSPLRAIMNLMFGYCRMLLSGAPYWGSSTWARTKGAKVVWWSTWPRPRAWIPINAFLFIMPRSMRSSALLAPSEYVLRVGTWIFYTDLHMLSRRLYRLGVFKNVSRAMLSIIVTGNKAFKCLTISLYLILICV